MDITHHYSHIFRTLGHPECLHLLEILARGPACVCDLIRLTGKRQPYISQQLIALRHADLVTAERQGRNILYRLNYRRLEELERIISALLQQIHNT